MLSARWILSLALLAGPLQAQTAIVTGWVVNDVTDQVLQGTRVTISAASLSTVTDDDGFFLLTEIPAGTHVLEVRRIGFQELDLAFDIAPGQSLTFASSPIRLSPLPIRLDDIIADAGRLGPFFARRAVGRGVFLTGNEIRELDPVDVEPVIPVRARVANAVREADRRRDRVAPQPQATRTERLQTTDLSQRARGVPRG